MSRWLRDYGHFLLHEKKWWLLPMIGWMALLAGVAWIAETGGPSFVYPIF